MGEITFDSALNSRGQNYRKISDGDNKYDEETKKIEVFIKVSPQSADNTYSIDYSNIPEKIRYVPPHPDDGGNARTAPIKNGYLDYSEAPLATEFSFGFEFLHTMSLSYQLNMGYTGKASAENEGPYKTPKSYRQKYTSYHDAYTWIDIKPYADTRTDFLTFSFFPLGAAAENGMLYKGKLSRYDRKEIEMGYNTFTLEMGLIRKKITVIRGYDRWGENQIRDERNFSLSGWFAGFRWKLLPFSYLKPINKYFGFKMEIPDVYIRSIMFSNESRGLIFFGLSLPFTFEGHI